MNLQRAMHEAINAIGRHGKTITGFSAMVVALDREPHYSVFVHCGDDCFSGAGDTVAVAIEAAKAEYIETSTRYTQAELDATLGIAP